MADLVVKTNRLNTATQNLSLSEIRLMQLAIVDARETGKGLSTDKPLTISASRYAEAFNVTRQTAYEAILKAEKTLFDRRFSFLDTDNRMVKSRWVQRVKYLDDEASIEVILTFDVVNEVTRIDGYEQFFTQYLLEQTATLKSAYSVRLYELLVQWKTARKTPVFDIEVFREQLGVNSTDYERVYDFKKNVLDVAVKEINEKTDIQTSYDQVKRGRKIIGFKFVIKEKPKKTENNQRDPNTSDMFMIDGLTDKQLWRISRHKEFISTYSSLAKGDAGKSWSAYSDFIVDEIKKDASKFSKKRPIREYLDGSEEDYDFSR
ncbi:replication initiation protein RepM (plasmid) [Moraxella osloensis]|jgi:plasmid replication initiation protein|uniref:replication initiation protein RepM n=1 Tax=Bacteria TaxID=2 RepID=UPI000C9C6FE7|nr:MULTISPECIES: replication initiation protein RepM [Bacteria]QRO12323.1 replication initiation protein RepM [Moraxella osloensis]TDL30274.1 RepB family plasmid replication initiator protein [Jeotgalibacillus sp. S-D1]WGL30352.1 replication initiation protein RepM [Psychrobacter sp. SIT]